MSCGLPRWLLGRHPLSFPNLFVPAWQVEGLATFAEGTSGLGRTHAPDVAAVMRAQQESGRTPKLDQLAGGLVAWPAGWGPYFFGGEFHEFLATRQGEAALGDLGRRTARRLPFFSGGAFKPVFGKNAAGLWQEFQAEPPQGIDGVRAPVARATRLTRTGYLSSAPRFAPGADGARPEVVYSSSTAHEFPSIGRISADGSGGRTIATRFLGNSMGFAGDWIVYDEVEFNGPVALTSDLYARELSGRRRSVRLSRGARLSDPDVSKDGTRVAAAQVVDGRRSLVVLPLGKAPDGAPALGLVPEARLSLDGCAFATPRWSPDGRFIAAVASCDGALPEILLFEPATGEWSRPAPAAQARDITPAWTPDGRWLLFASDRGGAGFAVYGLPALGPLTSPHRILDAPGGVTAPDVSPDGRLITFVSATPDGTDVFVAPLPDPASSPEVPDGRTEPGIRGAANEAAPASKPYSPWSTLVPRWWQPLAAVDDERVDLGAQVSASDALGRHAYSASVLWAAQKPEPSSGFPSASRLDWDVSYTYDRWFPTFFAAASGTTILSRSGWQTGPVSSRPTRGPSSSLRAWSCPCAACA